MQSAKCKMQNCGSLRSDYIRLYFAKEFKSHPAELIMNYELQSTAVGILTRLPLRTKTINHISVNPRPKFCILHFILPYYK